VLLAEVVAVGLDTPGSCQFGGPAQRTGFPRTLFTRSGAGFDIREGSGAQAWQTRLLFERWKCSGALWGHYTIFGANSRGDIGFRPSSGLAMAAAVILDGQAS